MGTNERVKLPAVYTEAILVFQKAVGSLRLEHDHSNFSIGNMDQTIVCMDCPAKRTNNAAGESSIRITNTGYACRGLTLTLCATAAGIKRPPLVVLKEPMGRTPLRGPTLGAVVSISRMLFVVQVLSQFPRRLYATYGLHGLNKLPIKRSCKHAIPPFAKGQKKKTCRAAPLFEWCRKRLLRVLVRF